MTHLHFTFGPVQGFVAQARRTRDLYAGSFLLSHLALKAMEAAQSAGGKVLLPDYGQLKALAGNTNTKHAVAPNRFLAEFADEDTAVRAGKEADAALQAEWRRIGDGVWRRFVEPVAGHGKDTHEIWERQIQNFWEIAWAVGPESDLLDCRKNWRTPPLTIEGGDHCTLMGQWQELSGFIRSQQLAQQNAFWVTVREHARRQGATELDLEEDERFCAIAFVKRFFSHVSKDAIGRELEMQRWPSTVSVAAIPWQRAIKEAAKPEVFAAARAYAGFAGTEPGAKLSSARRIAVLDSFPTDAGDFAWLSGNFLNSTALANEQGTPLKRSTDRNKLLHQLKNLEELTGNRAGNFYALLLMDGDSMGKLIGNCAPQAVTACLTRFASEVPALIEKESHSGICVYAGGDDLLAMLPLDCALEATADARRLYVESFAESKGQIKATVSAGLVFAHYRCAFSRVLEYAHELLDDVAKDGAGRDALAMGVLKPGGVVCQWSAKFDDFLKYDPHCFAPLIRGFHDGDLTSSFLYNLRGRFGELLADASQTPMGSGAPECPPEAFDPQTIESLFVAEYLHGRLDQDPAKAKLQRQAAERLMRQLVAVCQQPNPRHPGRLRFDLAGARLVKFLALGGKEGAE